MTKYYAVKNTFNGNHYSQGKLIYAPTVENIIKYGFLEEEDAKQLLDKLRGYYPSPVIVSYSIVIAPSVKSDLEKIGQAWSDYLHAKRQASIAVQLFSSQNYKDDPSPDAIKYDKPEDIADRKISNASFQDMWDKLQAEDKLYKDLVDMTEQYWIKQAQ